MCLRPLQMGMIYAFSLPSSMPSPEPGMSVVMVSVPAFWWGGKGRVVDWYTRREADTGRWESNSIYKCVESGVHTGVRHLV